MRDEDCKSGVQVALGCCNYEFVDGKDVADLLLVLCVVDYA